MAMDLSFLEVGGAMWPLLNWLCFLLEGDLCQFWLADGVRRLVYVQLCVWMILPNQTGGLQGFHHVSGDNLAVEKLGIGSGWQQSKQNRLPPAVMGYWI